jgi:hypothetical protein
MEEELRAFLLASSGVSALGSGRINWVAHPQGVRLPAIVLNVISGTTPRHMKGQGGVQTNRVQIDCDALTVGEAKQVSRDVIAALSGYRGGGFRAVFHEGTRDSREGGGNEAERPFRVSLDFETHWRAEE